jgi:probable O-glycosylation ligase (exosortase A-associated)
VATRVSTGKPGSTRESAEAWGRAPGRATLAWAGLLLFVVFVYSNPGNLFFASSGDVGIAKAAAALALAALGGSWLLADRPLHLGGAIGWLLGGFFAWVGLSATWSLWPAMTVDTLLDGLKYFAIFFLVGNVASDRRRAELLVHVVAWSSVIPAIGAIDSWAHGEHLVDGDRAAWIGIFANPNDLAYYLVVGVALALGGREITRSRLLRFAYLGGLAVMGAAILLTQSRGGLTATAAVLGLFWIRGLRRGRAAVAVTALVAFAIYFSPRETWQRAETIRDYDADASAQGRIDAWRTGINVMRDRPLTGVGAGAFMLAWAEYAPGDAGPPRSAHNTFVQVIAETGLPAFALFVGALLAAVVGLRGAAREGGELVEIARAVQVGIGGFAMCSLTGGLAFSWPLYLLLGLAASLGRIEREGAGEVAPTHALPAPALHPEAC